MLLVINDQNLTDLKEKLRLEFLEKVELEDWETQIENLLKLQEILAQEKNELKTKIWSSESIENPKGNDNNMEKNSDNEESKKVPKEKNQNEGICADINEIQVKRAESKLKSI